MENFIIVLFKNKKKKKIIKGYTTEKNANLKYKSLLKNNNIHFEVVFENSERCNYEIALLSSLDDYQLPLFKTDEIGRNLSVFMSDESDYVIKKIDNYKVEELIFDCQTDKRITFNQFLTTYCPIKEMKVISTLHNKLIVQIEDSFKLFSLKNEEDSERLLKTLESYFREHNRNDSIFVRDISTTHRKWMYDILEKYGFKRNSLYRQKTTFSKRT